MQLAASSHSPQGEVAHSAQLSPCPRWGGYLEGQVGQTDLKLGRVIWSPLWPSAQGKTQPHVLPEFPLKSAKSFSSVPPP